MHSDRSLACIRWREKAQVDEKKGFHGPIDSRPFRAVPPRCATESRLRPVPKLIQFKAMYKPRNSRTPIGGLRAYGGVGTLKSLKKKLSRTHGFPAISGSSPSVRNRDKTKSCPEVNSVKGNVLALDIVHSDRWLACIRWRGKAQVVEKQGFHGPMDSRPFRSVLIGAQQRQD